MLGSSKTYLAFFVEDFEPLTLDLTDLIDLIDFKLERLLFVRSRKL